MRRLAGNRAEQLATFDDLELVEAEAVARRRPAAVAVATFVTGFLAARFIKSSAHPSHAVPRRDAPLGERRPGGTRYPA